MRKVFAQAALISGLFLIAGVGQAAPNSGNAGTQDTSLSYLYFSISTEQPTASLNLIGAPVESVPVAWNKALPSFIDSTDDASMTGQMQLTAFDFTAQYNLIETASNETFEVPVRMTNKFCYLNEGTEPLTFQTSDWTYNVSIRSEANGDSNILCYITVNSTAKEESETCTENPNQAECITQCETSNGQEPWCAELCTTEPTHAWCTPPEEPELPVTQAIITIKNQVQ